MRLHEWVFGLKAFREMQGMEGAGVDESTPVVEQALVNIGATVMGRKMFGGRGGPRDAADPWTGCWGKIRPFTTRCSCSRTTRAIR